MNLNDPRPALKLVQLLNSNASQTISSEMQPKTPAFYVDIALNRPSNAVTADNQFESKRESLLSELEDLVYLLENHGYSIGLNEYSRLTKNIIAMDLMARVAAVELLQQAIDSHAIPYITKHGLTKDEILAEYAAELMEKCKLSDMGFSSTEPRVIILLANIDSVDIKTDVTIQLLRQTAVPWSVAIDELLCATETLKPARSFNELAELKKLMELKRTLYRYNVTNLNFSDLSMANGKFFQCKAVWLT